MLLAEVVEIFRGLARAPRVVVDGTIGLGGHATALLAARTSEIDLYVGIDRDPEALAIAGARLCPGDRGPVRTRVRLHQGDYAEFESVLAAEGIEKADFFLLDLGVSTYQLKTPGRGFSLMQEGPLDMRMDPGQRIDARHLLREASPGQLESWLRELGEVRFAGRVARVLWERRNQIETTSDLSRAVLAALPRRRRQPGEIHPATQVFQALRIAVNRELESLEAVLPALLAGLQPGGRAAVISFHSLEDRRVKQAFDRASRECICPPGLPVCGCGHRAAVRQLGRKALQASAAEVAENPPSRSARLRAVEKLP